MHNAHCIIHNRPPDVDVPEARPYIILLNYKELVVVDGEFGEFFGGVEDVGIEFIISNLAVA